MTRGMTSAGPETAESRTICRACAIAADTRCDMSVALSARNMFDATRLIVCCRTGAAVPGAGASVASTGSPSIGVNPAEAGTPALRVARVGSSTGEFTASA